MDNLPNDIHREIIKLLDSPSICNLYMTHKMFWMLTKEQINYHRLTDKVSPHNYNGSLKMTSEQMIWLNSKLTKQSTITLLSRNKRFNDDVQCLPYSFGVQYRFDHLIRPCCLPIINQLFSKLLNRNSVFSIWVKFTLTNLPNNYCYNLEECDQYNIVIPSNELADLIIKQSKTILEPLDNFVPTPK